MVINEGREISSLKPIHDDLEKFMEDYLSSLDNIESALSEIKDVEVDTLPGLVDLLRTDKDYYKKYKKEINSLMKLLPDIKNNLEKVGKVLLC